MRPCSGWNRLVLALAGTAALAGCSAPTGTVTGIVKYDGKTLVSGMVSFIPRTGNPISAEIQMDGTYRAVGVPYGEAVVLVLPAQEDESRELAAIEEIRKQWAGKDPDPKAKIPTLPGAQAKRWTLPARFSDPGQSKLKHEVDKAESKFDIDVFSK